MPLTQEEMNMLVSQMRGGQAQDPRRYPTKEEILAEEQKHKPEVIKAVKTWKREVWREVKAGTEEQKFEALSSLCHKLAEVYRKPVSVNYLPFARSASYCSNTQTITMNDSLSIVSTLHEFAHHLFGADETKACKWSVWLFKKTFPLAYEKLEWDGHLLRRPNPLNQMN